MNGGHFWLLVVPFFSDRWTKRIERCTLAADLSDAELTAPRASQAHAADERVLACNRSRFAQPWRPTLLPRRTPRVAT